MIVTKAIPWLSALAFLGVSVTQAQSTEEFKSICPSQNRQSISSSGTKFKYYCHGWNDDYYYSQRGVDTADNCAKLCLEDELCTGASWDSKSQRCYLTESRVEPVVDAGQYAWSIYMLRGESEPEDDNITPTCPIGYSLVDGACVSRETPFCPSGFHFSGGRCVENPTNFCPEGSIWDGAQCANPHKDECQQKLDSCQTTIDACAAEGEKCQLEKASCEALKTACEIDKTTYETQLGKCEADKVDLKHELEKSQNCETDKAKLERELENLRGTQALATCTPNTSKTVVIDGKTWKIWCTQHWHAVSLGEANKATFKECLDFCVSTPRCKSVLFDPTGQSHNTNCHLRTEIRATGPAQYRNSGWHTASLLH